MNNAIADRLAQVIKYNGVSVINEPANLGRLLAPGQGGPAGPEIDALVKLLQANAVAYLQKWAQHTGEKPAYETVRENIAGQMARAGALTAEQASWAIDAWVRALNLRPVEAPRTISLEDVAPPPPPAPVPPAMTAPVAGATVGRAAAEPARPRSPLLAPMGAPEAQAQPDDEESYSTGPSFIAGGRARPFGHGWDWFVQGWRLFAAAPVLWIVTILIYVVISALMAVIPVIGSIAGLVLGPVLLAGLMLGAHSVYEGEGLTIGHLFAGFRTHLDTLVLIAVVFALLMAGIVLVLFLIFGAGLMAAMMNPEMARQSIGLFLGALLVASLLFLPVMMAYGFAPALAAIGERGVLDSLKQSFTGCLRNVMPFILYSLVFIVLAVLASLPFMLGWIVLAPVAVASMYAAYRDIYYED